MSHNQNLVLKWFTQKHVQDYEGGPAIYGWDRPLLTFIYPGFDCGSYSVSSHEQLLQGGRWQATVCPMYQQQLLQESASLSSC